MNKYLLIDTNNFIEPLEDSVKKTVVKSVDLDKTIDILGKDSHTFIILPEIVEIEVKRIIDEKKESLKKIFHNQSGSSNFKSKKIRDKINSCHQTILDEVTENFDKTCDLIDTIFQHNQTKKVKLNPEIYINSYKKGVSGEKPFDKVKYKFKKSGMISHSTQPDCLIIESAAYYLREKKDYQFFIVTRDPDFFEDKKISKDISRHFTNCKAFETLRELLISQFDQKLSPTFKTANNDISDRNEPFLTLSRLIRKLEYSASFDEAREYMSEILSVKTKLSRIHLEKILTAIVSNPNNYTINQVLSVDNEQNFSKKLYMVFKGEVDIWENFADNLKLHYEERDEDLEKYNWLFKRLGMRQYKSYEEDNLPF